MSDAQLAMFVRIGDVAEAPAVGMAVPQLQPMGPSTYAKPLTTRGKVAAAEASERMPAFVLQSLGDALQALRGAPFTFEAVRLLAEQQSPAVKAWLAVATRRNVLGGWTRSRIKLFDLQRVGDRESMRDTARGRRVSVWRFPLTVGG